MSHMSRKIDFNTSDEEFKANYSPEVLNRKSTLMLKTSFHIINMILMGLCKVFKQIQSEIYVLQDNFKRPLELRRTESR